MMICSGQHIFRVRIGDVPGASRAKSRSRSREAREKLGSSWRLTRCPSRWREKNSMVKQLPRIAGAKHSDASFAEADFSAKMSEGAHHHHHPHHRLAGQAEVH